MVLASEIGACSVALMVEVFHLELRRRALDESERDKGPIVTIANKLRVGEGAISRRASQDRDVRHLRTLPLP